MTTRPHAAGLSKRHVRAGHVLQFNGGMLPDMRHPGAFVFAQAAHKAPRLVVGTAVLCQARQGIQQAVCESGAQLDRGPVFQDTDIDLVADDRKVGVETGAHIYIGG